jgi:hypothetical protein
MPKKVDNDPDVPWDALTDVLTKAMAGTCRAPTGRRPRKKPPRMSGWKKSVSAACPGS